MMTVKNFITLKNKSFGQTVRTIHLRPKSIQHIRDTYGYVPISGRLIRTPLKTVHTSFILSKREDKMVRTFFELEFMDDDCFTIMEWAKYHQQPGYHHG